MLHKNRNMKYNKRKKETIRLQDNNWFKINRQIPEEESCHKS